MAREFIAWLALPASGAWLDVGCGTGALTKTILANGHPAVVHAIDPAEAFVNHARVRLADPRARFETGDAMAIPSDPARYDAVVSALVLNFIPDLARALREMCRVARPGAVIAAYVWDYAPGMQMLRQFWDSAAALDPAASALDEAGRFPVCAAAPLQAAFTGAGIHEVEVRAIEVPTVFAGFADFWEPFLGGQGPAPTYVASLDEPRQTALRDHLRARLPLGADGSIALTARAWAVRGRAPGRES